MHLRHCLVIIYLMFGDKNLAINFSDECTGEKNYTIITNIAKKVKMYFLVESRTVMRCYCLKTGFLQRS